MAIRERKTVPAPKLPAARLFLDDGETIVGILREAYEESSYAHPGEKPDIRFQFKDKECDCIEDLQKLGGQTSDFSILVGQFGTDMGVCSLHLAPSQSWWSLRGTEGTAEWKVYGRLQELFKKRRKRWIIPADSVLVRPATFVIYTIGYVVANLVVDEALDHVLLVCAHDYAADARVIRLRPEFPRVLRVAAVFERD
jgi:hypothetical protein